MGIEKGTVQILSYYYFSMCLCALDRVAYRFPARIKVDRNATAKRGWMRISELLLVSHLTVCSPVRGE